MDSNKVKVALICFDNPFLPPSEGGKRGMMTRIQSLAQFENYEIDVYLLNKRNEGFATDFKGYDQRMTFYQYEMNRISLAEIFSRYPICVNKRYVKACIEELQKHEYDIVIYEGEQVAKYRLENTVKAQKHILYFHDIESNYRKAIADSIKNLVKKCANLWESKKFKYIENRVKKNFDYMWFVSKEEYIELGNQTESMDKCIYIPIPASDVMKEVVMNCNSKNLLYVGDMSIVHNFLSIKWFINEVFPRIREKVPEAECNIVGRISEANRNELQRDGVNVCGYVKDLNQTYADAAYVICPVLFGAGVKVKVIDALSSGQLVITTSKGVEGTDLQNGKHLIAEDNPIKLADICYGILKDRESFLYLAKNGLEYIKQNHTIEHQAEIIDRTISLLTKKGDV